MLPSMSPPPDDDSTRAPQHVMETDETCPDGLGQNFGDNFAVEEAALLVSLASNQSTRSSLAHALSRLRFDLDEAIAHHQSEIQRCLTQALAESRKHPACCPKCAAAAGGTTISIEGGVISPREPPHDSLERASEEKRADSNEGQQTMRRENPFPVEWHNAPEGEETGAFPKLGGMPGTAAGDAGADPARPKARTVNGQPPANDLHVENSKNDVPYEGLQQRASKLLDDKRFEAMVIFFIIANAITLGYVVQYNSIKRKHSEEKSGSYIVALEVVFLVFFFLELMVRIFVSRLDFFKGKEWSWNLFDMFVVIVSLADRVLEAVAVSAFPPQLTVLRMLRIVRVLRMLRIIRVVRFFRDLRLMIISIIGSIKSLFWVTVILFLMFYVFAICLTQGTTDYLTSENLWDSLETQSLREWFGSLEQSILSLLEAMIGGISWGEHLDVLSPLPALFPGIFLFFIVLSILAVLNIVTAVFVESAMDQAEEAKEIKEQDIKDAKEKLVRELKTIFQAIDVDQSGSISNEEMEEAMVNPEVVTLLKDAGINADDTRELFKVLDTGGEGNVDKDEFLEGCMKINGQASGLDLAAIKYQVKMLVKTSSQMSQQVDEVSNRLASRVAHPMRNKEGPAHPVGNKEVPLIFV